MADGRADARDLARGDRGDVVGLDRFGASAPGGEVLERLGFNVDNVVARAAALLERVA